MLAALTSRPVAEQGLRAWMRGAVRNLAGLQYRQAATRTWHETRRTSAERNGAAQAADEALLKAERSRLLIAAVGELPEHYRVVIVLRFLEELMPAEIADRLDLPLNTVYTRLQRGLEALRHDLSLVGEREGKDLAALLLPLLPPGLIPLGGAPTTPTPTAPMPGGATTAGSLVGTALTMALTAAIGGAIAASAWLSNPGAPAEASASPTSGRHASVDDGSPRDRTHLLVEDTRDGERVPVTVPGDAGQEQDLALEHRVARVRVTDARTGLPLPSATFHPTPAEPSSEERRHEPLVAWWFALDPLLAQDPDGGAAASSGTSGVLEVPLTAEEDAVAGRVAARGYIASGTIEASLAGETSLALLPAATLELSRGSRAPADPLQVRVLSHAQGTRSPWITLPAERSALIWSTLPPGRYDVIALAAAAPPSVEPPLVGTYGVYDGSHGHLAGKLFHRHIALDAHGPTSLALFDHVGREVVLRVTGGAPDLRLEAFLETREHPTVVAAVAAADGPLMRFEPVAPGLYTLGIEAAGESVLRRDVEISPAREPLVLDVRVGGGVLTVVSNEEEPSELVLIGPLGTEPLLSWDRHGEEVRFDGLPEGEYELWQLGPRLKRTRFTTAGTENHLEVDDAEDEEFASLTIRPRNLAPDEDVALSLYTGGIDILSERTDGATPLEIEVAPGPYRLVAQSGDALWLASLEAQDGVDVELDASALVSVKLFVERDGRPVVSELLELHRSGETPLIDWMSSAPRTSNRGDLNIRVLPGEYVIRDASGAGGTLVVQDHLVSHLRLK